MRLIPIIRPTNHDIAIAIGNRKTCTTVIGPRAAVNDG
jgi:hypothetical protein